MAFLVDDAIGVDEADAAYADRMAAGSELTFAEKLLIPQLVDVIWAFASGPDSFTGITMHPYQEEFGRRFIESVVSNDGADLSMLISRQAGKTEVVANTVAALMILLPILAGLPQFSRILAKFVRGVMIGTFAPVGDQAATLFDRIKERMTCDRSKIFLADPEIDDEVETKANAFQLKRSRSLVRVQTAHPKAQIESKTYHIIIIDEAQKVDEKVMTKSISPMGAKTNATKVMLGTPDYVKGVFYKQIKINQRQELQRGANKNHFQFNWKTVAKYNPDYAKYVKKEIQTKGADSDEFRMAYLVEWILERGMFITSSALDALGDPKMRRTKAWRYPCIVGIDPARKIDSTVVTVVSVDWDHPNENGLYHHLVLDWLDMAGEKWEEQYYLIAEFLKGYNVLAVGIDEGGMGDMFADRMRHILPREIQVNPISSSPQAQSKRWKYLTTLMTGSHPRYGKLLRYPAHSSAKRTKTWKKFYEQMTSLEKKYQGPYLLAEAPNEAQAHDDYCFVGETLVLTDHGQVPIKDIRVGDLVMTRSGLQSVLAAGPTGEALVITRFGITATPNHPFITTAGVKRFDQITAEELIPAAQGDTVASEGTPSGPSVRTVYNLKVANSPEFFANGILVHNCDSLALACIQSEEFAIPEVEVTESILSTRWR